MSAAPTTSPDLGTTFPLRLSDLSNTVALAQNRATAAQNLRDLVNESFKDAQPDITSETVRGKLKGGMWACGLLEIPMESAHNALQSLLTRYELLDEDLGKKTLELTFGLFAFDFKEEVTSIALTTKYPKHFASAVLYLRRLDKTEQETWERFRPEMEKRWPEWQEQPILKALSLICDQREPIQPPPLRTILGQQFMPGKPVIYSFQRNNRDFEGLVVIRRADGRFARNAEGNIWSVPQLTRSNSALPGFISNGSTPQGIHTIMGVGQETNPYIGRTPYIETALPIEKTPAEFFHEPKYENTSWTMTLYTDMLPTEWQNYWPTQLAWYAGKAGRCYMYSHGTTIDPDYYLGMPWYPNTPSLGCLTCKEIWNPATGKAFQSDQLALYNAWISACHNLNPHQVWTLKTPPNEKLTGYCAVIELDNAQRPVALAEVLNEIMLADKR